MSEDLDFGPATLRQVFYIEVDAPGRVYVAGTCQPWVARLHAPINEGNALVWLLDDPKVGQDLDAYHFDGAAVQRRAILPIGVSKAVIAADDADEAVITGIPEGATVTVDGVALDGFAGGELVLTSAMPATYTVQVEKWPFLPFEVEIVAQ